VFPVAGPPMADGVVCFRGSRIIAVGTGAGVAGQVEDLGNVAILPGLVNAHTHLDLSDVAAPLGQPGIGFAEWIQRVILHRIQQAGAGREAVRRGLRESAAHGTTSLGDIGQAGWRVGLTEPAPLELTIFLELIAPTAERVPAALELARSHVAHLGAEDTDTLAWHLGLSPHAPYSVRPELLDAAIDLSAARRLPLAFHLAESREEIELLRFGTGPLRDLLESLGAWEPGLVEPGARPLDYLRRLAGAHRALVIHGNYLDDEAIGFLGWHRERMAVVYCPRTHARFGHDPYPLARMLAANATVALGTDSRASSPDLSVLVEMREVARLHPDIPLARVLEIGTLRGAMALGRAEEIGTLESAKRADLTVIALPDRDAADPHELLLQSDLPVVARYLRGQRRDEA